LKEGTSVNFVVDNKTKVYKGIFVAYTESQDLSVEITHKGKTFYLRIDQLREIDKFKIIRL
jgi:predicted transcriptional regulator